MEVEDELIGMQTHHQKKTKKKSGGFQSMGLSHSVFKGIMKKGYKIPTPIQRKTIPIIQSGKDMVAMARTGSGKTAAFLIPLFEKLKAHSTLGARGLVLSPTRELAMQTYKFTRELGKFTGLRVACIFGGDKMEDQFLAIHENPDILIATPGRFLHVVVEMNLKLTSMLYVVFDEADRLFELGFAEQLHEILKRLPEFRQTLLFSATLPKSLVDFAKAGLHNPELVRLDLETKVSELLKMSFLYTRSGDKIAVLLYLLHHVIKKQEQTMVFVATKHDVEYVKELLRGANINCTFIYSSLDQQARNSNVRDFQRKNVMVMVVTDVAARGIDIPLLDNVINMNFPAKPKLFVHRVGRVARAGRSGVAYSLVSGDESAHFLDLMMFLGRSCYKAGQCNKDADGVIGSVPQMPIDSENELVRALHANNCELDTMLRVMENGHKQYIKSRELASVESVRRVKDLELDLLPSHPMFDDLVGDEEKHRASLLDRLKQFKPAATVFETRVNSKLPGAFTVMKKKREVHNQAIERRKLVKSRNVSEQETKISRDAPSVEGVEVIKEASSADAEFFVPYRPQDSNQERGLQVDTFQKEANRNMIELFGDDAKEIRKQSQRKVWDRKRKKYVIGTDEGNKAKKVKAEDGSWVPATYKTNLYSDWVKKNRVNLSEDAEKFKKLRGFKAGRKQTRPGESSERTRGELRNKDQILKSRGQRYARQDGLKRKSSQRGKDSKSSKKNGAGRPSKAGKARPQKSHFKPHRQARR